MSIQPIEHGHTNGYQIRVFRHGKVVATRFLAYAKFGGKDRAYAKAVREERRMNAAADREYGPAIRTSNRFGLHHQNPATSNRSKVPGVSIDYQAGYRRSPCLTVHVRWMEGGGEDRRQYHSSYSTAAHGLLGAIQLALDKRFEKTGIEQPSARAAWMRLRDSVPEAP